MRLRIIFSALMLLIVFLCTSQQKASLFIRNEYLLADKYFKEAEQLGSQTETDTVAANREASLNKKSLDIFEDIITNKKDAVDDSLLFHCYFKAGLLHHYFDRLQNAKNYYLHALQTGSKLSNLEDSFLFKPLLFTGSVYYSESAFDSALIFYKKAEHVSAMYSMPLEESERLYNRMGTMYYATGNYRTAENYFQKAISSLSKSNPAYKDLYTNYKLNIASILIKSYDYRKADSIINDIIPIGLHVNEIRQNKGIIHLRNKNYADALIEFSKVHYENNNNRQPELDYNFAQVYKGIGKTDSSGFYINRAYTAVAASEGRKSVTRGLILRFMADDTLTFSPLVAAEYYQTAINEFYPAYTEHNILQSPGKFSGVFSFENLFYALYGKSEALEKLYTESKDQKYLEASFNALQSAFSLVDFVSKLYESDESRLFLNHIRHDAHDRAIHTALKLYELSNDEKYLEAAFAFDQKNKGAALSFAVQENTLKLRAGIDQDILNKEVGLKSLISVLSSRLSTTSNLKTKDSLLTMINDREIELSKIKDRINSNIHYTDSENSIDIPTLQKSADMLDDHSALLSYHFGEKEIIIFCVTKNGRKYYREAIDTILKTSIRNFSQSLHHSIAGARFAGNAESLLLYNNLLLPAEKQLSGISRLLIIPDDELSYIPFEALKDKEGKYVIEKYAVQYNFSTAMLRDHRFSKLKSEGLIAGFAPFSKTAASNSFSRLPNSADELKGLRGKMFYDQDATKINFLATINKYPIIQLATHAAANDSLPERSFIAFYPDPLHNDAEGKLYAQEIYNLRLDSTQLIILSACETGSGALVKGEGLMSLTRAFAYAGSPNIITSLWNAADRTTAYITQHLHKYLEQGFTIDVALQKAKTDLLNDPQIPSALKNPAYWSHLIFIGEYEKKESNHLLPVFLIALISTASIFLIIKKLPRKARQ